MHVYLYRFKFVAFCGDGINDFCPMLRLGANDLALCRKLYAIGPFIERMAMEGTLLKAKTVFWGSGEEIIEAIESKLKGR